MDSGPPRASSERVPLGWSATSRPWASPDGTYDAEGNSFDVMVVAVRLAGMVEGLASGSPPPPPRAAGRARPPPHLRVRAHVGQARQL
eukprot:15458094-Alexandrium_andersonii.AAC.1